MSETATAWKWKPSYFYQKQYKICPPYAKLNNKFGSVQTYAHFYHWRQNKHCDKPWISWSGTGGSWQECEFNMQLMLLTSLTLLLLIMTFCLNMVSQNQIFYQFAEKNCYQLDKYTDHNMKSNKHGKYLQTKHMYDMIWLSAQSVYILSNM